MEKFITFSLTPEEQRAVTAHGLARSSVTSDVLKQGYARDYSAKEYKQLRRGLESAATAAGLTPEELIVHTTALVGHNMGLKRKK